MSQWDEDDRAPLDGRHWVEAHEILEKFTGLTLPEDSPDALCILEEEVERNAAALREAKYEKRPTKKIDALAAQLDAAKSALKHANDVWIQIKTDIEAALGGDPSQFKVVRTSPSDPQTRVTKHSAYEWLKRRGTTVDEWAPAEVQELADYDEHQPLTDLERTKFQVKLAVLARLYARARGPDRGNFDIPNHKTIAADMSQAIKELSVDGSGYSAKTIEKTLNDSRQSLDLARKTYF